ncbi:hypothetical protein CVV65_06395 [Kyrpidia spormannii]|uniref:EfeO-type cupredoxin-like domain-containing protein n=1 Tax=Kyrpidia spormannii TaxID=2055160 RepID=A0A2K8N5I6_9BACL|nr:MULTISPECIES: cupredoxin domain-containing protein [Kyrpidia]ATY84619.1 hypothetical protein CVV65_06395 [Kyrpidia spormannii]MCL6576266.1 cupredoxin domain-containing protein [Kyrpidia sp.]
MKRVWKKGLLALTVTSSLALAACGAQSSAPAVQNPASQPNTTATRDQSTQGTNTSAQHVYLVVEPGAKLGSDHVKHDAFINGDFTVVAGKPVDLTVYNYEQTPLTMKAADLGLNVNIKASTTKGDPAVTNYSFIPQSPGTYTWVASGDRDQWAAKQKGFLQGTVTVTPPSDNTQHISLVINPNYKLGPDGKLHDAYTPGDITVKAGQPVELTIYNLGKKGHPFISSALGVNVPVQGSQGTGEPAVFKTTFTPQKPGKYTWICGLPCDGENNQWAMSHDNYMMGYITVQ